MNPNNTANLRPFKSGSEWAGNRNTRRLGASVKEHWNALSIENGDGVPKYSLADIKAIADAPDDDAKISPARRIAARHLIEMAAGGRTGREITALVFDRTEGKAMQNVNLTAGPEIKRIILVDEQQAIVAQQVLPEVCGE